MVHVIEPERTACVDLHTLASLVSLEITAWDEPSDWEHERQTYNDDADPCPGGCNDTGWILQSDECYTPCETCNPEAAS